MKTIYETIPYQIHRLEHTPGHDLIAGVFNEEGHMIAALFVVKEETS
ncbi:hypothetical protein LC085_07665 [Bacillus tianshenii]|nr:hypothetical protein [Bacillus tianshenii]MCA1319789.1 hypothetical protein [Bacillus tianshenii]